MAQLQPIRIGETLTRTYKFYNPLQSNPRQPDTNSPVDFTGYTLKFVLNNDNELIETTVTAADGIIDVVVPASITSTLTKDKPLSSYIYMRNANGIVKTKAHMTERLLNTSDV